MLTLEAAATILDKALEKGRELSLKPLTVAVPGYGIESAGSVADTGGPVRRLSLRGAAKRS
jgi:hypothetical protein